MSEPIRFYFRGNIQAIHDCAPTRTVLEYLREDQHCTGTKEACAEGDCGACTVVLGQLQDGKVTMQAINACIQLLPHLDGKALFTVEDLKQADGSLHPVQQAMVDQHATQCGFCTPGFVMSLWALYLKTQTEQTQTEQASASQPTFSRTEIEQALSGNLCRCTGYRPIINAAQQMLNYPSVSHPALPSQGQLQALQRPQGWHYQSQPSQPSQQHHGVSDCFIPHTRAELGQLKRQHPDALLQAGSTDLGLWITKQTRPLSHMKKLIYLGQMASLHHIIRHPNRLDIGAMVSLNDAYAALCEFYPLAQFWQRFASHPIRNSGTLGGNLANGSPIGDSMPWLIALGAEIELHNADTERCLPLEDFYLSYQKNALRSDEWLALIRVPLPLPAQTSSNATTQQLFRTYKLAKRFDQDISAVCAAFALSLENGRIQSARIAYGGMAATPKRASACEAALTGQLWNESTLEQATQMLQQDYQPLSDMRASSGYRERSAQQLLRRFWLETRAEQPLLATALNVFES